MFETRFHFGFYIYVKSVKAFPNGWAMIEIIFYETTDHLQQFRDLFLSSPETFRAYFGYHNYSLHIFATPRLFKAIKLRIPLGCSYIKNVLKDQLFKTSGLQFDNWLFGSESSRDFRGTGPRADKLSTFFNSEASTRSPWLVSFSAFNSAQKRCNTLRGFRAFFVHCVWSTNDSFFLGFLYSYVPFFHFLFVRILDYVS